MKWTTQAEQAVSRVPFFVRRRVKKRAEEEAVQNRALEVTLEHVRSCQQKFLKNMDSEVKGYRVETCFGPNGCPNRAVADDDLAGDLERIASQRNLRAFLKERVQGPLKMHHEFRISVSDCPNACSRPQIVDIGLIGASLPRLSQEECSRCEACVQVCKEDAVSLPEEAPAPVIDYHRCVACGRCISVCPTATLQEDVKGYRILVGGKLGRHPQLGTEIDGVYSKEDALKVVEKCLDHYMSQNRHGERFGEILNRTGTEFLHEM